MLFPNLRNRIASVTFEEWDDGLDSIFSYATHYSYDIAGNVKQLVQDMPELATVGHRFKRIGYDYDLVSGKVNYVYYQRDSVDQFIHHYVYDEDNRVEFVRTSRDGLLWERDANYEYYLHGPLGRTELGERRVQGLDYAYTLQGWLKGMNASALCLDDPTVANFVTRDMGRDGKRGNTGELARNKLIARDVAAFTLGYYNGDYRHIGTAVADTFEMNAGTTSGFHLASPDLYNGNIRHTMYTIARLHQVSGNPEPEGYTYRYDQLNRLVAQRSQADHTLGSTYAWDAGTSGYRQNFREDVTYDPNGNILTYRRGGGNSADLLMDYLTYHYDSDNNKLNYISDAQTNTGAYAGDLEDQPSYNYDYDELGNLVFDANDGLLHNISWSNAQKLRLITSAGDNMTYEFRYNPMQQRVAKLHRYFNNEGIGETRTYYIRDAQGNVMATYRGWGQYEEESVTWDSFALAEQHIYGSARVGMVAPELKLYPVVPANPHALDSCHYRIFEGWKRYEITNHLGNVLAVITDRKRGQGSSGDIEWFAADVLAAQQYYPFGMLMPGDTSANVRRQYSLGGYDYRYGFNTQEKDNEIYGKGNSYTAEYWQYDSRIGRRWNVDPKGSPMGSPYSVLSDNPILNIDVKGDTLIPTGSSEFISNTQTFLQMIAATDWGNEIIGDLERLPAHIIIKEAWTRVGAGTAYDKIYYDDSPWFNKVDGGSLNGFLALGHEIAHSYYDFKGYRHTYKGEISDETYVNLERLAETFTNYLRSVYEMKPFRLRYAQLPNGQGAPGVFLQGSSDYFFNPKQEKITDFSYKISDNPEVKEVGGQKIMIKPVIDPHVSYTKSYITNGKIETTKSENIKVKLFKYKNE